MRLKGKVAVVTGAGTGIGQASPHILRQKVPLSLSTATNERHRRQWIELRGLVEISL